MSRGDELRAHGERTGSVVIRGEKVAYRMGNESGEIFACDEDFEGYTLTIEITSVAQFRAILRARAALSAREEGEG